MGAVVVGYLATPEGEAAVRQGIAESMIRGGRLVVVHSELAPPQDEVAVGERAASTQKVMAMLSQSDVDFDFRTPESGRDPVHDVLDTATQLEADVIVIGIRRRSPVGKLVLGSHAQSILLEAGIPVLAVKA